MSFPNFLLIGAQKAGTTSLYHYLHQHPQIFMSPVKEPGFFDFEGVQPSFTGPLDYNSYSHITNNIRDYSSLFKGVTNQVAIGEATTWYLYSHIAPKRIKFYIPNVKLIVVLRNPVDRAFSSFMHTVRDGREPIRDFGKALQEEQNRITSNWEYIWRYTDMGFYSVQLHRYFEYFDQRQLRIYLYEDLVEKPVDLLKDIFQFLNVDDSFTPEVLTRLNISGTPKYSFIEMLLSDTNNVKNLLKPILPSLLRKNIANYLRIQNRIKSQCPANIRRKLREVFREDILALQNLLQRDLSMWLE